MTTTNNEGASVVLMGHNLTTEEARAIILHNQISSPLLRLPAELRNRIFGLVVSVDMVYFHWRDQKPHRRARSSSGQRLCHTSLPSEEF
ncbi:hypothetical protein CC86DRAFT_411577 [Ophiobolus disseminans]|uniref:Uncharacterized protein n=1 Tax=Ophiobolus disseminans TaxID=1469910 RepID=A0A6A6ZKT8_9PLEO|nr:hypothetical protein CC86DRAFT_411577 [Ophiobolus disseminans]